MKCINCGKKEVFLDNLCKKCYLNFNPIIIDIKDIKLKKCIKCKKLFYGNKEIKNKYELKKIIKNKIVINKNYNIKKISVDLNEEENRILGIIAIDGSIKNQTIRNSYEIEIKVEKFLCSHCSRKAGKYYEGVFQIRSKDEDIINFFEKLLEKEKIDFSKKNVSKTGVDYYIMDKTKIRRIGEKLVKEFGGYLKESPQLYSKDRETSKNIYRLNITFKPLSLKKGDVFYQDNKIYKLLLPGKTNKVLDIFTGKEKRIKIKNYVKIPKLTARIVSKRPLKGLIKGINDYSNEYVLVKLKNPLKKDVKINSKVEVIRFEDTFYVINE